MKTGTTIMYTSRLSNTPLNIEATVQAGFRKEGKICQAAKYTMYDMERRKMQLFENGQLVKTRIYCGMYEKETDSAANVKQYCYIAGGNGVTAVLINEDLYFLRRDVQGTITGLIDKNDTLVEEYSYDAWGRRRNPTNWTYDSVPQPQYMHRGYTMHEMLDEFGLINMNGRCYDPVVGRFLSPDIIVQNPNNTQCYNRYSYAINNPLKYNDPSGWSYGTLDQMHDNAQHAAWLNMCEFNRRMQYESNISSVKIIGQNSLAFFKGEAQGAEHFSIKEIIDILKMIKTPGLFGNPGKHDPPDGIDDNNKTKNSSCPKPNTLCKLGFGNINNFTNYYLKIRLEDNAQYLLIPPCTSYRGEVDGVYIKNCSIPEKYKEYIGNEDIIIKLSDNENEMQISVYDDALYFDESEMSKNIEDNIFWSNIKGQVLKQEWIRPYTFYLLSNPPIDWQNFY